MQISKSAHDQLVQLDLTLQSIIANPKSTISQDLSLSTGSNKGLAPTEVISISSKIFNQLLSSPIRPDTQAVLSRFNNSLLSYVKLKDKAALKSNDLRSLIHKIEKCVKSQYLAQEFGCLRVETLLNELTLQSDDFPQVYLAMLDLFAEKCFVENSIPFTSLYRQKSEIQKSLFQQGLSFQFVSPFKHVILLPDDIFEVSLSDSIALFDALYVSKKLCNGELRYDSELFRNTYKSLLRVKASSKEEEKYIQIAKLILEYRELEMRFTEYLDKFFRSTYLPFARFIQKNSRNSLVSHQYDLSAAITNLQVEHQRIYDEYQSQVLDKLKAEKKDTTVQNLLAYSDIFEKQRALLEASVQLTNEKIYNTIKEYCAVVDKKIKTYDLIQEAFSRKKFNIIAFLKTNKSRLTAYEYFCDNGLKGNIADAKNIASLFTKNIMCVTDELKNDHNFRQLEALSISEKTSKKNPHKTKKTPSSTKNTATIATNPIPPQKEEQLAIPQTAQVKSTIEVLAENRVLAPIQEPAELVCSWHVSRWFNPEYNPFVEDENYVRQQLDPDAQQMVRIQHSFPLAFADYVKQQGFRSEYKDPQTKISYHTYTVGAEYETCDGKPVRGKLTLGFSKNGVLCHNYFSILSSKSYLAEYLSNGKLQLEEKELDKIFLAQEGTQTKLDVKLLDDSIVAMKTPLVVTERFVHADVESSLLGKVTFRVFFLLGEQHIQHASLNHIPNGNFLYR